MEQENEKKGPGLDYKTRVKIWTGIFAVAIVVWILYKWLH